MNTFIKVTFFLLIQVFFAFNALSVQGQTASIDSVSVSAPALQSALSSAEDSVLVTFRFIVKHPEKLQTLQVRYGKKNGKTDALAKDFTYVESSSKKYLDHNGIQYPIQGEQIEFSEKMPKTVLTDVGTVVISGQDRSGKPIKTHSKDIKHTK